MSTHSNPFVQGGWSASFGRSGDYSANPPSVYGALPMSTSTGAGGASRTGATHFQFMNPSPTILNSIVAGPHRDGSIHQLVKISTDERLAGYTAFTDAQGRSVALIEWTSSHPQVEVRGSVIKCAAGDWLKVIMDPTLGRPVRRMDVRGSRFVWCPNGEAILLYAQASNSTPLAVATKNRNVVNLEMSDQALSWGLLEPSIVAITLLLSGRRLE
ncbi:uncharacterized protein FOMMEDRAFT_165149 [Fomitiporia mediterranea MF3/22]|uniref:uncharacterized protein n=1 Tax=Fomitiporia mediterranea (strain MF3/22) TaxID=694068 RepID=UPI0004409557|nr:uncharacterized protein FOMMEDRAFT_165149 [Fomitiporia mediterranea MF3/22]EJD06302.1 hypothetical protein FOMMEDRAFT_165149 [Fomitiporia mediterranea MF3/22]